MPDLAIHLAGAAVAAPLLRVRAAPWRALFYLATCLPDVLYRVFAVGTASPTWYAEATHAPLVQAVWAYLFSLAFAPPLRRRAWGVMVAGMWLHGLFDMAKAPLDRGVVVWAFPLSIRRSQVGFLVSEESVGLSVLCLALFLAVEIACTLLHRRRSDRPDPTPT